MKGISTVLLALLLVFPLSCTTTDGGYGNNPSNTSASTTPTDTTVTPRPMTEFPPPGTDIVEHDLTIELVRILPSADGRLPGPCEAAEAVGAQAQFLEDIVFGGRMVLQRGAVTVNYDGRKRQPFVVTGWSANGYSKALQTTIQYVLSPNTPQLESSITSESTRSDFPVQFDFNVIFDAYANGQLVKPRHHGRPKGGGFHVIPPNGDRILSPTIRTFEDCFVDVPDPSGQKALFRFRPKECNDQNSQTVATAPTTPTTSR